MRLRCHLAIPEGFQHGRVLVDLTRPEADVLDIAPAHQAGPFTYQIVDAFGHPLVTHLSEIDRCISQHIRDKGYWEPMESIALAALVHPGMTVVDAGSNIGYYAMLLARSLQSTGRVLAFEPEPRNHMALLANALLLGRLVPDAAPVEAFPAALAEAEGSAQLLLHGQNLGLHCLSREPQENRLSVEVPLLTLDAVRWREATEWCPAIDRIHLIKADVQGGELNLLRGAERTLAADRPILCLEFEPYITGDRTCLDLVAWLAEHGYTRFRLFHSNLEEPRLALTEFAALLSPDDLVRRVAQREVHAYGTILAWPDAK